MSTRANIIIKDQSTTLYFYRHSDGYPECTGEDLKDFVKEYTSGVMRSSVSQSAGWLIVRGHFEYKEKDPGPKPNSGDGFSGWKVGAYEPTGALNCDVEYIYIIDLVEMELSCRQPKGDFWDNPDLENTVLCKEFNKVYFGGAT